MGEKKIHKLSLQKPFSLQIVGLVSHEQIFVLTNEIKQLSNIDMDELVSLESVQNDVIKNFNAYNSSPDENNIVYSLVANRCSEGVLVDTFKSLDYFLVLSSENSIEIDSLLLKKIKSSKLILALSLLELNTIKLQKNFESILGQLRS